MDLGLKGKRVLVTGGTRGIGAAIVDVLAAEGAQVAFCARQPAEVEARTAFLQGKGYTVHGAAADVADPASYAQWLRSAMDALGGVDVFIPNVSGGAGAGEEGWRAAFEVDMMAAVRGVEAVVPQMQGQKSGAIVMISSIAALEAMGGAGPYGSMKAALTAYASQLGADVAPYGIRVNTVSPGPIHVEDGFWGNVQRNHPEAYHGAVARQPFGRLGTAEEVARCVAFLASPAASWVTRTNMIIDGGFTRRVQF
ncbi:SDR family NAD(P)-dependent oxidoreductase [Kordiimonas marina]|uniref:SDR family NAD(P)-dependent oxidoreductase n=1 Tax=Kordiimonas marina TaxID=2872312 RepID=UPI001FF515D2|nr:SDR family oxidoreductase [Kordiimonas marina]MCJ9429077.1 SDR family oxidoreductase [Kordiimonas marina]